MNGGFESESACSELESGSDNKDLILSALEAAYLTVVKVILTVLAIVKLILAVHCRTIQTRILRTQIRILQMKRNSANRSTKPSLLPFYMMMLTSFETWYEQAGIVRFDFFAKHASSRTSKISPIILQVKTIFRAASSSHM